MRTNLPTHNYSNYIERDSLFLGVQITTITKPGFPNWLIASPASQLIAENVSIPRDSRVLYLNTCNGICGTYLAKKYPYSSFHLTDTNIIALESTAKTIAANTLQNTLIAPWNENGLPPSEYDIIILEVLKGRKITQRFILESFAALKIGGKFYLAGANQSGIRSLIEDARSVFGNASLLGYKKGNRICSYSKSSPEILHLDWIDEPGVAPGTWYEFQARLPMTPVQIRSLPGVFSYDKLDEGTRLLLQNINFHPGQRVLDIGCGWGGIGIAASLQRAQVDMVDADLLAIYSSIQNIQSNKLSNARVFPSDVTSSVRNLSYHFVASNPPFHSNLQVDYAVAEAIVSEAYDILEPGGELWLTANQFLTYQDYLNKYFTKSAIAAATSKYKILRAIKA